MKFEIFIHSLLAFVVQGSTEEMAPTRPRPAEKILSSDKMLKY
jgi:hypothetical protein